MNVNAHRQRLTGPPLPIDELSLAKRGGSFSRLMLAEPPSLRPSPTTFAKSYDDWPDTCEYRCHDKATFRQVVPEWSSSGCTYADGSTYEWAARGHDIVPLLCCYYELWRGPDCHSQLAKCWTAFRSRDAGPAAACRPAGTDRRHQEARHTCCPSHQHWRCTGLVPRAAGAYCAHSGRC